MNLSNRVAVVTGSTSGIALGIARAVAAGGANVLRDGMLVNLGIGIPTLVSKFVPAGLDVYVQSETGLIGTGAPSAEGMHHPLLTDAAGRPVSALRRACTFDSDVVRADPRRPPRHDGAPRPAGRCRRPSRQLDDPGQDGPGREPSMNVSWR
jgi:hypothetical protein